MIGKPFNIGRHSIHGVAIADQYTRLSLFIEGEYRAGVRYIVVAVAIFFTIPVGNTIAACKLIKRCFVPRETSELEAESVSIGTQCCWVIATGIYRDKKYLDIIAISFL